MESRDCQSSPWLHRFAVLTALATLGLIGIGGLVTSHEAGMSVPDWPTSYGYNMFALPFRFWKGGVFYEHTHRLWATVVGTMVVVLVRWAGGRGSRKPMALLGVVETLAGAALLLAPAELRSTGHFLMGIGGVVVLAALVPFRGEAVDRVTVRLCWVAFGLVQVQGLLGGLRVVLLRDAIGILHAALAQAFFALLCVVAVRTGGRWRDWLAQGARPATPGARAAVVAATVLIFGQLILGASMRHQHAGLAVPDFPLAYGRLWPAADAGSIERYNAQRVEVMAANPITAFQVELHMAHRVGAVVIVGLIFWSARLLGRGPDMRLRRLGRAWMGLVLLQALLGAATVWSNKAADLATAHVLTGALLLAMGLILCIMVSISLKTERTARVLAGGVRVPQGATSAAA